MASFNIHNGFKFSITGQTDRILNEYLEKELGYFKSEINNPDLEIRMVKELSPYNRPLDNYHGVWGADEKYFYMQLSGKRIKLAFDIKNEEPLIFYCEIGFSRVQLLTIVEQIMQLFFLQKGFTFIHGAAVSKGGRGICICAFPRTGKTNTFLSLMLGQEKYEILSEELSIINQNGMVFPYPHSTSVDCHQLRLFPSLIDLLANGYIAKQKIKFQVWLPNRYRVAGLPTPMYNRIINIVFRHLDKAYTLDLSKIGRIGHPTKIIKFLLLSRISNSSKVTIQNIGDLNSLAMKISANVSAERAGIIQRDYLTYLFAFPDKRNTVIENSLDYQRRIIIDALQNVKCYQINLPEGIPFKKLFAEFQSLI
ncbi:hypothetical protein ES703_105877 [subsurface metagenome]